MKHVWYIIAVLLFIAVLAGFAGLSTPTGAFIANLAPEWHYPTTRFMAQDGHFSLDLNSAFVDPDGDSMSYGVSVGPGLSAGVNGSVLFVMTQTGGNLTLIASDGKAITVKDISVTV